MKYRPRHVIEYLALRGIAFWFTLLPYRVALALGCGLAWFAFHVGHFRRRTALQRLRTVFPERSDSELQRIAWQSWRNFVFSSIEMLRMPRVSLDWLHRVTHGSTEVIGQLKQQAATGRGAIAALPHMGAWEMAGMLGHLEQVPVFNIAARQKNPLVADYVDHLRANTGIVSVSRGAGTMRTTIRRLRGGGILAILPDVRVHTEAIPVPFLGGIANLGKGMGLFARHANVPIFPVVVTRIGWARHRFEIFPAIEPDPALDKDADVERMTRAVLARIDERIRQQPEQWFWFNKRWVLDPVAPKAPPAAPPP